MTTTRRLALVASAAVLVGLLAAGAGFLLSRSHGSKDSLATSSASGSRVSAVSSTSDPDEITEVNDEGTSIDGATAEEGTTSDTASAPVVDAPVDSPDAAPSASDDSAAPADSAPSSSSSGAGIDPRLRLDGIPRLTTDLVGPLVSSTKCAALNYFETYVTDDSAIESVKVRYLDGPITRRTTTLTRLDHHGDGNYFVGFLVHTSPTPLSDFVVTAVDVRGNTTVKSVRVTCP